MTLAHEHLDSIKVLDAVIADMRASGDTGHVENLLQARADFVEAMDQREELGVRLKQVLPYLYLLKHERLKTAIPVETKILHVESALARIGDAS